MIGVYFLLKNNAIVYIGQSIQVEKRIKSHTDKDFDSFRVIPCEKENLLHYERRLINYFKPILNGVQGGKRDGAGRPKGSDSEPTVVMRIPIRYCDDVNMTELPNVIKFLLGEGELDGVWYGDHPHGKGAFWWRKELRTLFENQSQPIEKEQEVNQLRMLCDARDRALDDAAVRIGEKNDHIKELEATLRKIEKLTVEIDTTEFIEIWTICKKALGEWKSEPSPTEQAE